MSSQYDSINGEEDEDFFGITKIPEKKVEMEVKKSAAASSSSASAPASGGKRKKKRIVVDDDDDDDDDDGTTTVAVVPVEVPAVDEALEVSKKLMEKLIFLKGDEASKGFRFITTQCQPLAWMFACLARMFTTIHFTISKEKINEDDEEEGIVAAAMNNVSMSRWWMEKSKIVEGLFFSPKRKILVRVDLVELSQLLRSCASSDSLCLSFDNDENPGLLQVNSLRGNSTGSHQLKLMDDEDGANNNFVPIEYSNRVTLSSAIFSSHISTPIDSKYITLDLQKDKFSFKFDSDLRSMEFIEVLDDSADVVLSDRVCSPARFSLEIIRNAARLSRAVCFVHISLPESFEVKNAETGITELHRNPLCFSFVTAIGVVDFLFSEEIDADEYY